MTREEKIELLIALRRQRDAIIDQITALRREIYPPELTPKQREQAHAAKIRQQQQDGA